MLVGKGALTFRAFEVSGKNPVPGLDRILERLDTFSFKGVSPGDVGAARGGIGPDHLFDGAFTHDKIFRGPYALFALRVDTVRVPGPLVAAHTALEIEAIMEAEGLERVGRARKQEIKQEIRRRLMAEMPPAQRSYGIFWSLKRQRVYLQSTSKPVVEHFLALFTRAFELDATPLIPGVLAANHARDKDLLPVLRDAQPSSFDVSAELVESVS